jgi:hypothetical protein
MANNDLLNTPVLWINKYLQEKIQSLTDIETPFFPSSPSTLNDLTSSFPPGGVMGTWDRLIKMNKTGFPHIKCEQVMYYFYTTADNSILNMVKIQEAVLRLMDRFDETAEEVNNWARNRQIRLDDGSLIDNQFYFHNFKVYQLQETRDIIDFGTARTYGGNKIIIDYDYHQMGSKRVSGLDENGLTSDTWTPEPKLATKIIL